MGFNLKKRERENGKGIPKEGNKNTLNLHPWGRGWNNTDPQIRGSRKNALGLKLR